MRRLFFVGCAVALASVVVASQAFAAIVPFWQTNLDANAWIPGMQLTPDGSGLKVATGTQTHGGTVTTLDPQTGAIVPPRKPVSLGGLVLCRMVLDNSGNVILGDGWGGGHVYKYDPTVTPPPIWTYYNSSPSFEYVRGLITDSAGNIYAGGDYGSGPNQGGTIVKISGSSGTAVWSKTNKVTSWKDTYSIAMALSPAEDVVYRGGFDLPSGGSPNQFSQGRVYGYLTTSGTLGGSVTLDLPLGHVVPSLSTGSGVGGLATDSSGNLYIGYQYQCDANGQGQIGVLRVNSAGTATWSAPLTLGSITGSTPMDALVKRSDDCYFLAFTQGSGSTSLPGLAKFSSAGKLLGMDTISKPGYRASNGFAVGSGNTIYMGLDYYSSGGSAVAVALNTLSIWNGGGGGGNWSIPANWSGWAPAPGETLTFGTATNTANNNDYAPGTQFAGITFNSGTPAYTLSGNSIALSGPVTNNSSNLQTIELGVGFGSSGATFNTAAGDLSVTRAISGAGTLNKTGTGTLFLSGSSSKSVGNLILSAGTINLNSGLLQVGGTLSVATTGQATLNITNGGTATSARGYVGSVTGLWGTVTVDGVGSTWASGSALYVGSSGSGTLNISNGGSVSNDDCEVGTYAASSAGTVTLDDAGSKWTNSGDLYVGVYGTGIVTQTGGTNTVGNHLYLGHHSTGNGTYNLNGGVLALSSLSKGAGTGTFNFGGGTLKAGGTLSTSLPMTLTGTGGYANVDSAGYPVTLSGNLSGAGGLNKLGLGTVNLTGTNNYGGSTTIYAGALQAKKPASLPNYNSAGSVSVKNGATLAVNVGGSGEWAAGDIDTLRANAAFSRGSSLGIDTTNATGDFTYGSDLSGNFGLTKLGSHRLVLTGANSYLGPTTVNAGTLQFSSNWFDLSGRSVQADTGAIVEYNNATITGGYLQGLGTHFSLPYTTNTFNAVTTANGTHFNQGGTTYLNNFTNGGWLFNSTVGVLTWNGGSNVFTGTVEVTGTLNASSWGNQGVLTVDSGGTLNNAASNLVSGGGSRIYVGSVAVPGGLINVNSDGGGRTLELNGALLVNNGTISGTTNVNYGSLAKGAGVYGPVNVNDGGKFSPGNSPGLVSTGAVTLNGGGQYLVEINNAASTAGTGWDLWNVNGPLSFAAGTTANSKFTVAVASLSGLAAGPAANFVNTQPYFWPIASASGGIAGFDPSKIAVDATAFANNTGLGHFEVSQTGGNLYLDFLPSLAGDADLDGRVNGADLNTVLSNYNQTGMAWGSGNFNNDGTVNGADLNIVLSNYNQHVTVGSAVPEPGTFALLGVGVIGLLAYGWRRRRVA
jgi:T5SS/PEP-CTERM-associated repeat protein/autotransporter-associated beta strand protein